MLTVALYGTSLMLSSIGELLQRAAGLRVVQVDSIAGSQATLPPDTDVLVFDVLTATPASVLTLWHSRPLLTLVGIDLHFHEAFVVTGSRAHLRTPGDLVDVIASQIAGERSH